MYYDELFEKALAQAKEENFAEIKRELVLIRDKIDAFLTKFFESTTANLENDLHVTAV